MEKCIYEGHVGPVYAVTWSPDAQYIASGGHDTTVHVVQVEDAGQPQEVPLRIYRGHSRPVKALSWSPDSKYLASAGDDATVQVWDTVTGEHIVTYDGHASWVRTVAWSPDGKFIASASDENVKIWKV